MKAIILTSIIAVFLSVSGLQAGNPTRVYNNVIENENGTIKEYTVVDTETSTVLNKSVYKYNADGLLLQKTEYKWDEKRGWSGQKKYEYEYNNNNTVANIVYTCWDSKLMAWSPVSQHLIHIYGLDGELLTIKQFEVNNIHNHIASK